MIRRLLCRILGHDWDVWTNGNRTVGTCWRCDRIEANRPEWEAQL